MPCTSRNYRKYHRVKMIANFSRKYTVLLSFSASFVQVVACWRLQLCLNGSALETTSAMCKYGVWFTEPRVVHKICFENGIWAIYREFCEENPVIWTVRPGTKGCTSHHELGKRIVGVVPLGRDEYGAILSTSNRKLFFNNHKLKHGMRLSFLNPHAEVEILTWGPPSMTFSLQQFVGNDILLQCFIKGRQSFFGYYKIKLESYQNVSLFLAKNLCAQRKLGFSGRRVQILPTEIDFDIIQSSSEDTDMNCEVYNRIDDQFDPDTVDDAIDEVNPSHASAQFIEKRVDEETQRVLLRLLGYHFNEDKFELTFEQWEFLDVAKQIFLKVCPESLVPTFFVEQIYLLFQAVLHESFKLFPDKVNRDIDSRERILKVLTSCLANSIQLHFNDGAICTKDAPLLKKEFANGTKVYLLVDMPQFIKIDVVNYDLIMESIWKLMNFVHYFCADTFQEFASDHSLLESNWYGLFSPLVIRRWKYPGRSYKALERIFTSINLDRSVKNLDYCVSAARLHSSYKGWLKRPLSHWDKLRKLGAVKDARPIWEGQAHCMDDYMYPAFKLGYPIEKCGIRLPELPRRMMGDDF